MNYIFYIKIEKDRKIYKYFLTYGNYNTVTYNINSKMHSFDNKPAYFNRSMKMWYNNGLLHREDGPAVIYIYKNKDDNNQKEYWLNGNQIDVKNNNEFKRILKIKEFL